MVRITKEKLSPKKKFKRKIITKEQGVEVRGASAWLQSENSPAVLCKVEVLEHVKGLDENHG